MFDFRLSQLSPPAKLFVGLTTILMLVVCLWVAFIYYVDKGMVSEEEAIPLYERGDLPEELEEIAGEVALEILADEEAVLRPSWDSNGFGMEMYLDTAQLTHEMLQYWHHRIHETDTVSAFEAGRARLRENVGLAHTHINGQTLLFFVLGLFFVFTSTPDRVKKIVLWSFSAAVLVHAICLSGESFHWLFDDILAVSGVAIIALMMYMSYRIFVELGKSASLSNGKTDA